MTCLRTKILPSIFKNIYLLILWYFIQRWCIVHFVSIFGENKTQVIVIRCLTVFVTFTNLIFLSFELFIYHTFKIYRHYKLILLFINVFIVMTSHLIHLSVTDIYFPVGWMTEAKTYTIRLLFWLDNFKVRMLSYNWLFIKRNKSNTIKMIFFVCFAKTPTQGR